MNRALAWFGVAVALCAPRQMLAANAETAPPIPAPGAAPPARDLPLVFEVNQGQVDARARFVAHARDMDLYFAKGGALLSLAARDDVARVGERDAVALRLGFAGANPDARIEGFDELPGRAHYLLGNDPAKWHVDIPTFRRVRYRDVYPGIDVVYYGRDGMVEFDIEVAPGADPAAVRLRIDGADSLALDGRGDLRIRTVLGEVVQHRPVVHQVIAGERREVRGDYVLLDVAGSSRTSELAFVVGDYDPRYALVLDPTLAAASMVGGSGAETSAAVAADASGNWYFAGHTASTGTGFPTTTGAYQTSNSGAEDVFVRKVGSDASTVLYSTLIGGTASDFARGLAVGASGIAVVVGRTTSANFPTQNALQATKPSAGSDASGFVAALNAAGNGLVYSTYLGGGTAIGPASTDVRDVAVDADGNAYVTGETNTTDLPASATAFQATSLGQFSAFVFKLDAAGARRFGTYVVDDDNGFGADRATRIAIDSARNVYIVGQTNASFANDYNEIAPSKIGPGGGSLDTIVARINHTGEWLDWITLAGGSLIDSGAALDIDAGGRLVLAARSLSPDLAPNTAHDANWVWLAQLDRFGGRLGDSTWLGGAASTSNIFARDLVWDGSRVVVVGDVQNPSTLPAVDPVAAIDCGTSCGTSSTIGAFVCSYTSEPLAVESCTRVVATGGSGAGGARYSGVAQPAPPPAVAGRRGDAAKAGTAERKAVAAHADGNSSHGAANTSGTTQQLVQAFIDFVFGPRQPFPPVVGKGFHKRRVKPGEIVGVTIFVGNPKSNPATITDLTMEDILPGCLTFAGAETHTAGLVVTPNGPGRILLGLGMASDLTPGEAVTGTFYVMAGPDGGICTNTTSPITTSAGTVAPVSATIQIEPSDCQKQTTGVCTDAAISNASCWSGGVAPTNNCVAEIMPCTGSGTCTLTNDQPLGEKLDVLRVLDESFSLIGSPLHLVGGIDVPAGGVANIATRVENVDDELAMAAGGNLTVSNTVALDGASVFDYGVGTIAYTGGIEGDGELVVFQGLTRISTIPPAFAGDIVVDGGTLATSVPISQPIALFGSGMLESEGPLGRVDITNDATWSTSNQAIASVSSSALAVSGNGRIVVDVGSTAKVRDTIAVSGPVTLAGGTIEVRAIGAFTDGTSYTVITSTSGITGCFTGATTDEPGVTAMVACTANAVTVTVDVQVDLILSDGFENPP